MLLVPSSGNVRVVNLAVAANNVTLSTILANPTYPVTVLAVVAPTVQIGSASHGSPALRAGTLAAGSRVFLVNKGSVIGAGGPGAGQSGVYYNVAGTNGGDAINCDGIPWVIDNTNGNIFGGGGGGGNGGGFSWFTGIGCYACGGGGGGGRGSNTSTGGIWGSRVIYGPDTGPWHVVDRYGTAGGNGSPTAAGSGGLGCWITDLYGGTGQTLAGDGGAGGDYGAAGSAGGSASGPGPYISPSLYGGGAGGAAGNAVRLNTGSVTWAGGNNGTQVKGSVS